MPDQAKSRLSEGFTITVNSSADILSARAKAREVAAELGFSSTDLTFIATAISALARNILRFAKDGHIRITAARAAARRGIVVVASDHGPGLPANVLAGEDSSDHVGLRGVRRFMDEMIIDSTPAQGTTITVSKWRA